MKKRPTNLSKLKSKIDEAALAAEAEQKEINRRRAEAVVDRYYMKKEEKVSR